MNKTQDNPRHFASRATSIRNGVVALALMLFAFSASGASIRGLAVNTEGELLTKVSVCLALASTPQECEKLQWTNKKGAFSFSGLKPGTRYIVAVNRDRSAANRKFEQHANYAWQPSEQLVTLISKKEKRTVDAFIGKFNFSNFQRVVNLTAADFPELASIDLAADYVALKVFIRSNDPNETPQTIFLGQVRDTNNLQINASVPLASPVIEYEIFSANLSLNGAIQLAQP